MMSDGTTQCRKASPRGGLRRGDQLIVATLALFGLVGVVVLLIVQGGGGGDLVEFDQAHPDAVDFKADANTATWPELAQLPGIGETLARRIVEERRRGGPFLNVADIPQRVQGIGPKKFQKMRPYLYLGSTVQHATSTNGRQQAAD
jgi:competence protein ComEA